MSEQTLILLLVVAFVIGFFVIVAIRSGRRPGHPIQIHRQKSIARREQARAERGEGMGCDELAKRLKVPLNELQSFKPQYFERNIPKRSGDGVRILHVPDKNTKSLQRRVLHLLLRRLKAHECVHGFERGRSIVTNAIPHVGKRIIIKLDIQDFFATTRAKRIDWYFRIIGWNAEAAALLTHICTYNDALPQGAPTSPRLSNLVNYKLDRILEIIAKRNRCTYTRYADDITFSCSWKRTKHPGTLARGIVQKVAKRLKPLGYDLNRDKVRILRSHQQQRVTGLVVNAKAQLPRQKRRWLRAVEHRLKTKGEASLSATELHGWKALQLMIERQSTPAAEAPRQRGH